MLVSLTLASCISSSIVPREGRLQAIRDVPYSRFMEMIALPGDDLALVRRIESDSIVLERYDDTLATRWSTKLNLPTSDQELEFPGGFLVYIDQDKRELRHSLFYDGRAIGLLYWRKSSYRDSLQLVALLSDPADGHMIREETLDRFAKDNHKARVQRGYYVLSPDHTKLAVFGYDYSGIADRDKKKSVQVSGRIFSSDLKPLGDFSFDIPFGDDAYDIPDTEHLLRGAMVDNQGNFCQPVIYKKTQISVFQYDIARGNVRSLVAFADLRHDDDMQIKNVTLLQSAPNTITACAGMMDDDVLTGILHARFDFAAGGIEHPWYYRISEEMADLMTGDDELEDFVVDKVAITSDGRVTFSLEYQDYYLSGGNNDIKVLQYKHRDILLFGFTPQGSLIHSSTIKKDQKSGGGGKSFTQRLGNDGLLRVVYPIAGEMLYLWEMPLATGEPAYRKLAEIGNNNGFAMTRDVWLDDRTIVLHSTRFTLSGSGSRIIRMQLP